MVNETSAAALLKGDMFLLVLGGDFFHIRNRALVEYPGSAHKNTGQLQVLRGIPKGDRRPPLCRRGGGVHRGGTPSKGSRPYACFWLLFARAKSDPGLGRGGPGDCEQNRSDSGEEMLPSLPPGGTRISAHRCHAPAQAHQKKGYGGKAPEKRRRRGCCLSFSISHFPAWVSQYRQR